MMLLFLWLCNIHIDKQFLNSSLKKRTSVFSRSSHQEVFQGKGVLKICSKFTEEHSCRSTISIKLHEMTLRHGWSPVNLLLISRWPFFKNTSGWLLLIFFFSTLIYEQEQPSRGVLLKRYSENRQQLYRRKSIPKCDFNKVALQLYWNYSSAWVFL